METINSERTVSRIRRSTFIMTVNRAMIHLTPVLMVGAFSLFLTSMPIGGYQTFIKTFAHGMLYSLFDQLYHITFEMLSVYMSLFMGYYLGTIKYKDQLEYRVGVIIVSVGVQFIFNSGSSFSGSDYGPSGMCMAIAAPYLAASCFMFLTTHKKKKNLMAQGMDLHVANVLHCVFPVMITLGVFALGDYVLTGIFQVGSTQLVMVKLIRLIFRYIQWEPIRGLVYVIMTGLLWFCGIHGSNMLEGAVGVTLKEAMSENAALVAYGLPPMHIVTKPFIDTFVLMGGCGATLSLAIAMLLFSKHKGNRRLIHFSVLPMLINVNESVLFGLPIVFNPSFFVPFLMVPISNFIISNLATAAGLVPYVTKSVEWTTTIFFNGYISTGSFRACILQLVNLLIGVMIYAPFVRKNEQTANLNAETEYHHLVAVLKESERTMQPVALMSSSSSYGMMAKSIVLELENELDHPSGKLKLYYQPQYYADGTCAGAEALLRWDHLIFGMVYPPLIFRLAEDAGILERLEEWIMETIIRQSMTLPQDLKQKHLKISLNITGTTIQKKEFEEFLERMCRTYPIPELNLCIEITEQATLRMDEMLMKRFEHIRAMGFMLAVDDFSMGSTSIQYMVGESFNYIKLDGKLVQGSIENERCAEIIQSIVRLSKSLSLQVVAEYVSDEKIKDKMEKLGCDIYQGWYYSPAVPYEVWLDLLKSQEEMND